MNLLTIAALFSYVQTQKTIDATDKIQKHNEMVEQRVEEGKKYLEDHMKEGKEYFDEHMEEGKEYFDEHMEEGKEYFDEHMEEGKEYLSDNAEKGVENLDKIMDDVEKEVNHETHTGIGSAINNIYKSVKNKILSWFK